MCCPANPDVDRISFMLSVADTARADVTMTADRVYYRFATEDTLEDGELPAKFDDGFNAFAADLLGAFRAGVGVPEDIEPVKFTLFVNNVRVRPEVLSVPTLRAFVEKLASRYDEFAFLRGFA